MLEWRNAELLLVTGLGGLKEVSRGKHHQDLLEL